MYPVDANPAKSRAMAGLADQHDKGPTKGESSAAVSRANGSPDQSAAFPTVVPNVKKGVY